jgi:hypothetical protein
MDKNLFLTEWQEGTKTIPIVGHLVWWSVYNVSITRHVFECLLEQVGLDKKYAHDHNYRSSLIRALHSMEEDRIIRFVEENPTRLVYQFTAEKLIEGLDSKEFDYKKETVVIVDKKIYRATEDFAQAVSCSQAIKNVLIEKFAEYKTLYKSSDITRYLQNILVKEADIVMLRPQGGIYFVPAGYKNVVDKLVILLQKMGNNCSLDCVPLPAIDSAKNVVKQAFTSEIDNELAKLEKDIAESLDDDKKITDKWTSTRVGRLKNVLDRLEKYQNGEIVSQAESKIWVTTMKALEQRILGARKLQLD